MNERVGGGFQRVPTDTSLEPTPIYPQYSPMNESVGQEWREGYLPTPPSERQ